LSETIKLVVCVPSSGRNHFAFTFALASLMARLAGGIASRPDAHLEVTLDGQMSSCIHSNREALVRRAIDTERTHLLFLDDDMGFDPRVADILLGRRHPVVACNYLIKEQDDKDPRFVAVAPNGRRVVTKADSTGLQEITYSGFGVSLFEVRAFAATPQPWFQPTWVPEAQSYTTEDNPCFTKLRAHGFPALLDHDASKLVTHWGDKEWKWDQWRPAKQAAPEQASNSCQQAKAG